MSERLWTPDEIAERLRVKAGTVRGWIRRGDLPAFKAGAQWRVRDSDLRAYLAQRTIGAAQDTERGSFHN